MKLTLSNCFTACGCACRPHCLDWSQNDYIAFASTCRIALVGPQANNCPPRICGTFYGHKKDVTCLKWIKNWTQSYLVSGSIDQTAIVWHLNDSKLTPVCVLNGCHGMPVTYVCGCVYSENELVVITCGADSILAIWKVGFNSDCNGIGELQQQMDMKGGFVLCVDLIKVENCILLAAGTDDNKIKLFLERPDDNHFMSIGSLSGHADWTRDLAFGRRSSDGQFLLASCSQDCYIRIWKFKPGIYNLSTSISELSLEQNIETKAQTFQLTTPVGNTQTYGISLEAVLSGHESWVYSVKWNPNGKEQLLTASMDKSLILWQPDDQSGVWIEMVRVGDVGGQMAGFYGAVFSNDGTWILGHSYQGGMHLWHHNQERDYWETKPMVGGHSVSVEDIDWEPRGHYLLSCSVDQTTRLYGCWIKENQKVSFFELGRPQVHGHDMNCMTVVSSTCFVSGAEEKIFRAFQMPKLFAETLINLCGDRFSKIFLDVTNMSDGASVPSLGLSNKAVTNEESDSQSEQQGPKEGIQNVSFQPAILNEPPTENHLMQSTLWPEVYKLYGHGYEVFSVACNHSGTVLASACKASKLEHAIILLWDTSTWQQITHLQCHNLTITDLKFSPNDQFLLSVSRDRTWTLFQRNTESNLVWSKMSASDKKTGIHSRIIWSCSWSHDSKFFFTASRDKKVVAWQLAKTISGDSYEVSFIGQPALMSASATAVDAAHSFLPNSNIYIVAVGLECGLIGIYSWQPVSGFILLKQLDKIEGHCDVVKRLRFRPDDRLFMANENEDNSIPTCTLASCSTDGSVKIHSLLFQ